jgi:hypothetical protein
LLKPHYFVSPSGGTYRRSCAAFNASFDKLFQPPQPVFQTTTGFPGFGPTAFNSLFKSFYF